MLGLVVILAALASSLLASLALRLPSLVATLLASYVALVGNLTLVTLVLSPFREVNRSALFLAETVLVAGAAVAWWLRGRPGPPLAAARAAAREIAGDRVTLVFVGAIAVLLGYELVLALSVPPNNWDAVSYHLARVAAWYHHGGIYWVQNAPTDRINEFQPVAEQQIYFLFAATRSTLLYALPQYVAELAILTAIYGAARRLGHGARASAAAACLFATFGIVAYESSTAQNDLVAAALPAAAVCLLLSGGGLEMVLAGAAAGVGLGVKLTTALVWPVLVALALLRGRRAALKAAAGALAGFAAIADWGFVLNLAHTGHVLGHGGGRVQDMTTPGYPRSVVTLLSVLYETMDLSVLWPVPIAILAAAGALAGAAIGVRALRSAGTSPAAAAAARVAVPFLSPALVIIGAAFLAVATRVLGHPLRGPGGSYSRLGFFGGLNNAADESASAFGPVGGVVLLAVPMCIVVAAIVRKIDRRQLALAAALPTFLVLLALVSKPNPWLARFLLIPAALTAPLLAGLFRGRATTFAYLVVGVAVIALGITRLDTKRLFSSYGAPWDLTQTAAIAEADQVPASRALAGYDAAVPANAAVGAVLSDGDPSFLLGGEDMERTVVYLPLDGVARAAAGSALRYVVIADQPPERPAAAALARAGWTVRELPGKYWLLAVAQSG